MIRHAESLYPPRDLVTGAHWCCRSSGDVDLALCNGLPRRGDRHPWWHEDLDGTRVPFAITAGAVRYYLSHRPRSERSSFSYRASVERHREYVHPGRRLPDVRRFADVYLVRMSLDWSSADSAFQTARLVVYSAATGALLAVFGDGETVPLVVDRLAPSGSSSGPGSKARGP